LVIVTPARIDDPSAILDGIANGLNGCDDIPIAAFVKGLGGHQADLPAHSGNADPIIAPGPDGSRDMSAVAMIVYRVSIAADKIITVDIIRITVAIIIDAVARY